MHCCICDVPMEQENRVLLEGGAQVLACEVCAAKIPVSALENAIAHVVSRGLRCEGKWLAALKRARVER